MRSAFQGRYAEEPPQLKHQWLNFVPKRKKKIKRIDHKKKIKEIDRKKRSRELIRKKGSNKLIEKLELEGPL
jgi:hypothetical protein